MSSDLRAASALRVMNEVIGRQLVVAVPISVADFERIEFWAESEGKSVARWCREVLLTTCEGMETSQTFGSGELLTTEATEGTES